MNGMRLLCRGLPLWLGLLGGMPLAAHAQPVLTGVVCHLSYGGETKPLRLRPVASPYAVEAIEVGSYFLLRGVWQAQPADLSSVKLYTYAAKDEGAVLLHQASYPVPTRPQRGGFTGQHSVYEPVRDGELQYWCEGVFSAGQGR